MPGGADRSVGRGHERRRLRHALVDLADDFLEQIFEADDARRAAVLVDHHRQVRVRPLHRRQHVVERAVSGTTGIGRTSPDATCSLFVQPPQQILHVQHADDVIEVALVDRIARVTMLADDRANLVDWRGADRNADDADARDHHLRGGEVAELEQLAQIIDPASSRSAPPRSLSSTMSCSSSGV